MRSWSPPVASPSPERAAAPGELGSPRLHLRLTDSTNERARELAAAGAPHGSLVTASEQSAGRGRQGRRWSAPPGSSLLASLILTEPPRLLPLSCAVAVCDALDAVPGADERPRALIKWPNDIVLARGEKLAKLAGILIEARPQQGWAVMGVGLNVSVALGDLPPELRDTAATLGLAPEDVETLLSDLLRALESRIAEEPAETLAAWAERDALKGRRIAWGPPGETGAAPEGIGVAQGIDGDGRLVVALDEGGQTSLGSGEVHLRSAG
jgi:BirA family transcriptional regulator, biotin operon repressor / biotin---[acetyl-CoA-carboxylase] ligase